MFQWKGDWRIRGRRVDEKLLDADAEPHAGQFSFQFLEMPRLIVAVISGSQRAVFCLFVLAMLVAGAMADTITLKSGENVEGTITQETAKAITVAVKISASIPDERVVPRLRQATALWPAHEWAQRLAEDPSAGQKGAAANPAPGTPIPTK